MRLTLWVLILLVVGVGCAALVYGLTTGATPVAQPIEFNHTVHIDDAKLECADCHKNATLDVYAGLPGKQICLDCHDIDEEQGGNAEKDRLFAFDEVEEDIPWIRVATVKPDVFFSHRRHVVSGQIDCLVCHVDQPTLKAPPTRVRRVMGMTDCIRCHDQNNVSTDCLACHR